MKGTIVVKSAKVVKGFIPPFHDPNRYCGSRVISRTAEAKSVFVTGTINGEYVEFYSPTTLFTHTHGMLNYVVMDNEMTKGENSWFKINEGGYETAHGAPMFDGGSFPNVAIKQHQEIVCKIIEGDLLPITYTVKKELPTKKILFRVRVNS